MGFVRAIWIMFSLFFVLFYPRQITHSICFGRHRDQEFKKGKKVYYLIYGSWTMLFIILCLMIGSAVGVDHTFEYGWKTIQVWSGNTNYFYGRSVYDEKDYKYQGDFTQEYYIRSNEDVKTISKEIIWDNFALADYYHLENIDITFLSMNHYAIYDKGEVIATIDVKRAGLLKKISFHWSRKMLNQRQTTLEERKAGLNYE